MKNFILEDPEIGNILFKYNSRAKKYIIRIKPPQVIVTIPYRGKVDFAKKFFWENKNKIIQKLKSYKQPEKTHPEIDEFELRKRACEYLPKRLDELAQKHGFQYREVKIRKSKTRWGSCSIHSNINLSIYLMILPEHLINYVLLHELCHTIEMNHSIAFWNLLDKHTNNQAKALREELKNYNIYLL